MIKPAQKTPNDRQPLTPGLMFFQLSQPKTHYLDAPRALVYSLPGTALQVYLLVCDIADKFPHLIFSQNELATLAGLSRKTIGYVLADLDPDNAESQIPAEARLLRRRRTDYGGYRYEILPPPADVQGVGESAARWGAWRNGRLAKNLPVNPDAATAQEPSAEYDEAYSLFASKYPALSGKDLTPTGLSWNWSRLLFAAQGNYALIPAALLAIEQNGTPEEHVNLFEAVCARIRRNLAELALTNDSREQKLRHYRSDTEFLPELTQIPVSQFAPCVNFTQGGGGGDGKKVPPPHEVAWEKSSQLMVQSNADNALQTVENLQSPKSSAIPLPLPPRKSIYTTTTGVLNTVDGKKSGGGGGENNFEEKEKTAAKEPSKRAVCKNDFTNFTDAIKPPDVSPTIKPGDDETGVPRDLIRRAEKHGLRSDVVRAWIASGRKHGKPFLVYDALSSVEKYCDGINVGPERVRTMFAGALVALECKAEREASAAAPLLRQTAPGPLKDVQSYLDPPPPELVGGAARIGIPPKAFLRAYHAGRDVCLAAVDALEESGNLIKIPAAAFERNVRDERQPSTTYRPRWRAKPGASAADVMSARRERDAQILAALENNIGKFYEGKYAQGTAFRLCIKNHDDGRVTVERWSKPYGDWTREIQVPLSVFLSAYRNQIPLGGIWKPLAEFPEAGT